MRRYLLGFMSEAEEARVERDYLGSDETLEQLRVHEDELIEDYLRGALEPGERAAFERLFLASPARLERLVFLRALQDRAGDGEGARGPSVRSWGLAAAAVGAVAVAGILVVRAPTPVAGPRPHAFSTPSAAGSVAAAPTGSVAAAPPRSPAPVSARLGVPAVRGVAEAPVVDPGAARQVALEVPLEPGEAYSAHRGRVTAPDGRDAFVSAWQPNRGETTLRILVPAAALRNGRHVLVVEGSNGSLEQTVESYAFRVRRR